MTDREKAGLRGPVRSCMQEYEQRDRYSQSTETIYDVVGNLLVIRSTWMLKKLAHLIPPMISARN
jgi:hypothetical protein